MPVDDFALARGATAPVTSKQEAEKVWEPKFIAEIVSGKDPRVPIERETEFERPPTVADLLKLYRTRYVEVEPLKSRAGMLSQPNVLSAQLGTLPATALERPDAIEDFKARYANRDRDHQSLPGSVVSRLQLGNWSGSSASRRADSPCRARR